MIDERRIARVVLLLVIAIATVLMAMVVLPLSSSLFVGGVLAGALGPAYERLVRRLKGRRNLAALILTLGVVLALILPIGALGTVAVREAMEGMDYVQTVLQSEGVSGILHRLPEPLQELGQRLVTVLPQLQQSLSLFTAQGATAAAAVGGILTATTAALVHTIFTLIALFFFLTDGGRLVRWLGEVIPLGHTHFGQLLADFRKVSFAVLFSTLATAGVQTVVAVIGYSIARVPNLLFFTLVTFFIAFVPGVGAAAVSVFLAAILFLAGRGGWGSAFLVIWGLGVVGLVDNVVKPLFIRGGIEMHGAVVFFSLIGGLAAFGVVGLLAGPLTVAFFVTAMGMGRRELQESTS